MFKEKVESMSFRDIGKQVHEQLMESKEKVHGRMAKDGNAFLKKHLEERKLDELTEDSVLAKMDRKRLRA